MEHVHNVTRHRSRYQTLVIDVISYNSRIIQEYFQPKIGRKIRIFSLGWKDNILIKKESISNALLVAAVHVKIKLGDNTLE